MTSYTVDAEYTGKWWVLQCRERPGAITQVQRLEQASQIVEAIAFVSGEETDTIAITVAPRLPEELSELVTATRTLRQQARELEASVSMGMRRSARELLAHGLSQRDAAIILGVSHQRVQQLVSEPALSAS